jgi:hypothetical protein
MFYIIVYFEINCRVFSDLEFRCCAVFQKLSLIVINCCLPILEPFCLTVD